jgi:uncharacterized protein (TIGR02588 family)
MANEESGTEPSGTEPRGEGGGGKGGTGATSPWEWVTGAVSAFLVLGAIGFMVYEEFAHPDTPAQIVVTVDTVFAGEHGFVVQVRASNEGGTTAAGLMVQGELKGDTGVVETAEATLDYVPPRSHRRAGLLFTHDPARYALEVRPKGYDLP